MRYQFNGPADDGGSGIIRWEYQYSTSPTFASGNSAVIASSGTSIATGLTPRTTYYFRSRGVNAVGNAAWSSIKSATTLDVPDAPDLSIASYNSNSVTLNLTDPAYTGGGITGRLIEASTSPTFDTIAGSDTASPWTITGLARGTFYYLRARVTNSFGNSSYDTTGFTTDLDAPSTPTGYAAHDIASRTAWSYMGTIVDNGGAALSQLNYQINTSASATGATDVTLDTAREPMFSALVPGTTYYYRLRVKNPQTWSAWGAWVSFVAKTNVPHEPTALATSAVGSTTVTLGWTDPVTLLGSTITGHRVVIGTNKALTTGVQTADTGAAELSRVFTGLTPGTVYYARVYTLSSNGDGSSTGLITFTTAGGGSVPDLLWENVGGVWKQITLWENVAGVWKQITLWENVSGTWENGL
jgi:titin